LQIAICSIAEVANDASPKEGKALDAIVRELEAIAARVEHVEVDLRLIERTAKPKLAKAAE
jgi:hypothetical protein